ncbi:3'-5' exonuclease [Halalkalibacter alkalisediminis]|uniref:Exonuclease domain-containing protein n=1 Tax=Halalkalibacter alkalisediminis TaxID=935616 RepID=A0ABV6NCH1_9BACI|nr:3'-5' exonuclease [Halalkalibacter alkalisediminis]
MAQLKQYIFFDFEMLCASKGLTFESMEAIRLGAVKYDLETRQITTFDQYIKPISNEPLSEFCKKLTGISDEDLIDAADFKEVLKEFLTWVGGIKKSQFFSWSSSDLTRLCLDASFHEISSSTIKKIQQRYVDFQAIFTQRVSKTNASVETALHLYGLTFVGEKHNPKWDAYNTLRIYLQFLNQPLASDLIMLKSFIFEEEEQYSVERVNTLLHHKLIDDFSSILGDRDTFPMKEASKLVKKTRNLVKKYNNILINRSGLFSQDILFLVKRLVDFHHTFISAYEEHRAYSSKIIILDDSERPLILKRR